MVDAGLGQDWGEVFADATGSLFDDPRHLSSHENATDAAGSTSSDVRDYVPWSPRPLGDVSTLDALPRREAVRAVRIALEEVVEAEGPVHADRLARLIAAGFGLGRVSESRKAAVLGCLPKALVVDDLEPVIWPASLDPSTWRGYRPSPTGVDRYVEHLPLREVVNAMVDVCRSAGGMDEDELLRETLAVFGGRRLTAGIRERLAQALSLAIGDERLRRDGEVLFST